jgi:N-acetylneuraminic acid mutarotase
VRIVRAAAAAFLVLVGACTGDTAPEPPAGGGGWVSLPSLPTPRTEVVAAVSGEAIVVAGGFAADGSTVATVEMLDVASGGWSDGPDLPLAVDHAGAASWDGIAYVAGGYTQDRTPSDRAFALTGDAWEELPRMPEGRAAGGLAAVDGRLFMVGGIGPDGLADATLVYDVADGAWSTTAGLLTPREHLGVTSHAGFVYAVGGRVGGLEGNLATAERLDAEEGRWEALDDMPTARGGLGAAATPDGLIVAVGGEANEGTFEEVEALDVADGAWRTLPDLPTPRHGLGVVAIGGEIHVIGGGPEPRLTVSGAVEVLSTEPVVPD